jgi:hypothetical protein
MRRKEGTTCTCERKEEKILKLKYILLYNLYTGLSFLKFILSIFQSTGTQSIVLI